MYGWTLPEDEKAQGADAREPGSDSVPGLPSGVPNDCGDEGAPKRKTRRRRKPVGFGEPLTKPVYIVRHSWNADASDTQYHGA